MITKALLEPVIALVIWTAVMWVWMYATRLPAIGRMGMIPDPDLPNGVQMAQLPASVRWKADNYNHLLEQPTIFYATVLVLALLGSESQLAITLSWVYVGIRVIHSFLQALWNKIEVRFAVFSLSSLVLFALVYQAAALLWF